MELTGVLQLLLHNWNWGVHWKAQARLTQDTLAAFVTKGQRPHPPGRELRQVTEQSVEVLLMVTSLLLAKLPVTDNFAGHAFVAGSTQILNVNESSVAALRTKETSTVVTVAQAAKTTVARASARTRATSEPRWVMSARAARAIVTITLTPPRRLEAVGRGGVRVTVIRPEELVILKP